MIDFVVTNKTKGIINFNVLARGVPEILRWFSRNNPDQMFNWLLEEDGTISKVSTSQK